MFKTLIQLEKELEEMENKSAKFADFVFRDSENHLKMDILEAQIVQMKGIIEAIEEEIKRGKQKQKSGEITPHITGAIIILNYIKAKLEGK